MTFTADAFYLTPKPGVAKFFVDSLYAVRAASLTHRRRTNREY